MADYELLDGIKPNSTDPQTQQFIAAPICLLYKDLENNIMPIAIQVSPDQTLSSIQFHLIYVAPVTTELPLGALQK